MDSPPRLVANRTRAQNSQRRVITLQSPSTPRGRLHLPGNLDRLVSVSIMLAFFYSLIDVLDAPSGRLLPLLMYFQCRSI
jgi:hypothetical protein